jgi:MerR family transcriptional regulator, light-induced transcriptional regulator
MRFTISPEAFADYEHQGPAMTDSVNRAVASSPQIHELIGRNPLEVMYANHRHHHHFMLNVIKLNGWEMLHDTVPWVYRSYSSRGFSFDYFLAEFNAWIEAVKQHLAPAHAAEIIPIYEGFIAGHPGFIAASAQEREPTTFEGPWVDLSEELIELLTAGDSHGVIRLTEDHVSGPEGLQAMYLGGLGPALVEIGKRWEEGKLSVASEHLASAVVIRVMAYWYHHVLQPTKSRGKAVVTSGPGEFHGIGGAMLADLLAVDGWETSTLGPDTPTADLLALLRSQEPDLLAVSVCMPFNINRAKAMIEAAKELPRPPGRIMVGGQAFDLTPDLWRETGADLYASSASEAVLLAREEGRS